MADAIVIENVTKTFGPKVAVRDLDLKVPLGRITGFIGPNGAGKTTTIRMIMAILFPDSGRISVLGRPSALESKDRIGYLPEERGLYRKMRVAEFLRYTAQLKGLSSRTAARRVPEWLERLDLMEASKKRCEECSKGMQQKVQFISAVIHEPELIILDEPFSGLDPVNRRLLRELIDEQHRAGRTIIFSTHAMFEAEQLCDQIFMIHEGRKVLDSTIQAIRDKFDPRALVVEPVNLDGADALTRLPGVTGVVADASIRGSYILHFAEGVDIHDAMARVVAMVPVRRVETKRVTLEDVFIDLVGANQGGEISDRAAVLAGAASEGE